MRKIKNFQNPPATHWPSYLIAVENGHKAQQLDYPHKSACQFMSGIEGSAAGFNRPATAPFDP
jgi:hypothetical protein